MRSATPAEWIAITDSPPPTTVNPSVSAIALATATVPAANSSTSKTPIGPFQNTVLAPASASRYRCRVLHVVRHHHVRGKLERDAPRPSPLDHTVGGVEHLLLHQRPTHAGALGE